MQPEAMIVICETLTPVIILQRLRQDMLDGDLAAEVLGDRFILIRLLKAQQNRLRLELSAPKPKLRSPRVTLDR